MNGKSPPSSHARAWTQRPFGRPSLNFGFLGRLLDLVELVRELDDVVLGRRCVGQVTIQRGKLNQTRTPSLAIFTAGSPGLAFRVTVFPCRSRRVLHEPPRSSGKTYVVAGDLGLSLLDDLRDCSLRYPGRSPLPPSSQCSSACLCLRCPESSSSRGPLTRRLVPREACRPCYVVFVTR